MQQLAIVSMVLAVVLITVVAAFVFLYRPFQTGPEQPPFSTDMPDDTGDDTANEGSSSDPSSGETVGQYIPKKEVYNVLLIGHDRAATLADVIMLVNYDVPNGKVSIMQLPRDTYFEGDADVPQLNVQFSTYYNRAKTAGKSNAAQIAADELASVLERNLCIKIHYTAVLNLNGFVEIVDALGGVRIDVPYDMEYEDPDQNLVINIKKGLQTLNGAQAEGFVRFREDYEQADIGRVNAQKLFMTAFIETVKNELSTADLSKMTQIVTAVLNNLTTDIPAADAVYFLKNALSIDFSSFVMMTVPCDYAGGLVINRAETLRVINQYFNIYNTEISNSIFDPELRFTNENNEKMHAAYLADKAVINDQYTADEIIDSSIDIPLKKES